MSAVVDPSVPRIIVSISLSNGCGGPNIPGQRFVRALLILLWIGL